MNPSDPLADLYAQIFKMVESEPRFKIEAHRTSKAALSQAMLAKPYKGILPESFACEPKIDGVRVIVEVCRETHLVVFKTRNGNPLPAIQHFEGVFSALATVHGVFTFDCDSSRFDACCTNLNDAAATAPAAAVPAIAIVLNEGTRFFNAWPTPRSIC